MVEQADQCNENRPESLNSGVDRIRVHFATLIDQADADIEAVNAWTTDVKTTGSVRRRDQELHHIMQRKFQAEHSLKFILETLGYSVETAGDEEKL